MAEIFCKDYYREYDVVIIGAGPSGLAAAMELKKAGIRNLTVLEREQQAGGIPRHCGHPPFGIIECRRILRGPAYARRLAQSAAAAGVEIQLGVSVTGLHPGGMLSVISASGPLAIKARRVLLATGTRETPRSARLVSGGRPLGICTTGVLQSMFHLKQLVPFRQPVVVGTEIVAFSALLTCKKAGIRPVAMLESSPHPSTPWPLSRAGRIFGVPLRLSTRIVGIRGKERVRAVRIVEGQGEQEEISCDGVLFTGLFIPESSLARQAGLRLDDTRGTPLTDRFGRCSDPVYYATGNLVHHPVKMAGGCWLAGRRTGRNIARDLAGGLPV